MTDTRAILQKPIDTNLTSQPTSAELISKDFLNAQEKIMNGTALQKRHSFVHLMTHHLIRGISWLSTEVKNELLQLKVDEIVVKKTTPVPIRPSLSIVKTLEEIRATLIKDEKKLTAEELHALSRVYSSSELCGNKPNYKESVRIAKLAVDKELAVAQNFLASSYHLGTGVKQDYKNAMDLLVLANNKNHPNSQYHIGLYHHHGWGIKKDEKIAVNWFKKAADQLDAGGQYNLGMSYLEGKGVDKDPKKAIALITLSAEQGYASAQYTLAVRYIKGMVDDGVSKDDRKAAFWFNKAAAQYHARALHQLALCYLNGEGVAEDSIIGLACADISRKADAEHKPSEQLWKDTLRRYVEDRLLVPLEFIKLIKPIIEKYAVNEKEKLKIEPNNMNLLSKTFIRALETKSIADELLLTVAASVSVTVAETDKKAEGLNIAVEKPDDSKKTHTITCAPLDLPNNIRINCELIRFQINNMMEEMIKSDFLPSSELEVVKRKESTDEEKTIQTDIQDFTKQVLLFMIKLIVKFQDTNELDLKKVPNLVKVFETFLNENERLKLRMCESTALAPLPSRDAVVYRALDVANVIWSSIIIVSNQNTPKEIAALIVKYLLPIELEADLNRGLIFTPELANALGDVSCEEKTARITFDAPIMQRDRLGLPAQTLQACRDRFFQINREHFLEAKNTDKQNQTIVVDAHMGDRLRGYSVLFSTKLQSNEFEILKQKLTFAMEYMQSKRLVK